MADAYIYDAIRTPRGRGKNTGALYTVRPTDLLAGTLRQLAERNELDTREVEDVVIGCVTQAGEQGTCIARFAALTAGSRKMHTYFASGSDGRHASSV